MLLLWRLRIDKSNLLVYFAVNIFLRPALRMPLNFLSDVFAETLGLFLQEQFYGFVLMEWDGFKQG